MDLNIKDKKEEPLLSRIKISAQVFFEQATPSNDEIRKKIASAMKCDEKVVAVKSIYTEFGRREASVSAYVYNNEESMKKFEPKQKEKEVKKKEGEEEKPSEGEAKKEEPKEEAKEEKPKEEEKK